MQLKRHFLDFVLSSVLRLGCADLQQGTFSGGGAVFVRCIPRCTRDMHRPEWKSDPGSITLNTGPWLTVLYEFSCDVVQSNSASSTSCVWWYIAASTATHHLTWRTWSRRRPLQLSDLTSDLPHTVQLQCHELYIVARRPVLRGCWSTCMEQTSTTASLRFFFCCF